MSKNHTLGLLVFINLLAVVAITAVDQLTGWITMILNDDVTMICKAIIALTAIAVGQVMYQTFRLEHRPMRKADASSNAGIQLRLDNRLMWPGKIRDICPVLGLAGTVIGLYISTQAIDFEMMSTIDGVRQVVADIISGMGIALTTTLFGALAAVWITFNMTYVERAHNRYFIDHIDVRNGPGNR